MRIRESSFTRPTQKPEVKTAAPKLTTAPRLSLKDRFEAGAARSLTALHCPPPPSFRDTLKKILDTAVNAVVSGAIGSRVTNLTPAQQKMLQGVYGQNMDFSHVKLVEMPAWMEKAISLAGKAFGGDGNARAFTVGGIIFLPKADFERVVSGQDDALLVHEAAHVLQYRNGDDVIHESLSGQHAEGPAFYKWEDDLAAGKSWSQLNVEAQAHLMDEAFKAGFFDSPDNRLLVAKDGSGHLVIGPNDPVPDGYRDVTRVVRDGQDQLRGEPPLPGWDGIDNGVRVA